ncbi:LysM peptidoglycan-binding domain-containing protein [Limosilactobacillus frumenti]|nr:GH25 family lysozyme [Limosilactobacillus frumenti]QFG73426.1 LysM peptidoglycan-binding domain-containing protein [Limosilactobacillus frumenti]
MAPVTTGTVELNSQYLPVVKAAKGDHGVDWSKYQGTNGVWGYNNDKFSISQIGGTTTGWNLYDQWTYPTQVASTIAQGKRAHTYIWWQNVTTQSQADYVLNYFLPKVQTPKGSIVALDVESGYQNTAVLDYALTRIKNAGYTPVLYGYKNYLMNNTNLYYLAGKYQLWLAEYPNYAVTPYPNYNYFPSFNNVGIFQFTSTYIAGGLDGDIDLTGITDNGYKNGNPQKPQTTTPAVNAGKQIHQDTHTYVVRSGDSWWAIANRYHMSMYALAQLNGCTIQTVIHPGQVLRVADSGQGAKVSNKVQQPIAQPNQSTWRDNLGDTWHSEKGTFTLNSWVNLRWGARTSSSLIATLRPGSQVKYDAWSYHNGYTWIRQPRANGYAYMAVRNSSGPFGSFSN